uniref:MFS domain-containing protein n=1 Tax=Rhabditophanes sp. KR3021 TaxID=114890 RepID=A0AC35U8R7_9BILA
MMQDIEKTEECKKDVVGTSLSRRDKIIFAILFMSNITAPMCFTCIATFFNKEGEARGLSLGEIGVPFGIFNLFGFFFAPLIGKIIPIFGVRKVYIFSLICVTVGTYLFALTHYIQNGTLFLSTTIALRILQSFGNSGFFVSSLTCASNDYPSFRSFAISLIELAAGVGYTAGPSLGGMLYDFGSYQLPFIVLATILVSTVILAYIYIPVSKQKPKVEDDLDNVQFGFKELASIKDAWFILVTIFLVGIVFAFNNPTLPEILNFLSSSHIAYFFLCISGTYALITPVLGYLLDKYDCANTIVIIGQIAFIFSLVIIGPSMIFSFERNLFSIAIGCVFFGIADAALYVPCLKQMMTIVQESNYPDSVQTNSLVSGVFSAFFNLGSFIGASCGAYLVSITSYRFTTTLFSAVLSVYFVIFVFLYILPRYCRNKKQITDKNNNTNKDKDKIAPA